MLTMRREPGVTGSEGVHARVVRLGLSIGELVHQSKGVTCDAGPRERGLAAVGCPFRIMLLHNSDRRKTSNQLGAY